MNIEFDCVSVELSGRTVVDQVSASSESGQILGLVGPNGSGKSTLLRTVYRGLNPASGTVRLGGEDVRTLSHREVARRVAVMLQDSPTDFDLTVEETVMLGRAPHHSILGRDTGEDVHIVEEAMHATDVVKLADRMVSTLSGGQRQRVLLARALAQRTPALLLDEPSNHLDISHQHELMSTVASRGGTVIAALHDLNLAMQYCDRILLLKQGSVVAMGTPSHVLTPELIRETFAINAHLLPGPVDPVLAFTPLSSSL